MTDRDTMTDDELLALVGPYFLEGGEPSLADLQAALPRSREHISRRLRALGFRPKRGYRYPVGIARRMRRLCKRGDDK